MRIAFTLLILLLQITSDGQNIAGFENFNLERGKYINDASPADGFESGSIILPNDYNADWGVWSGFSISADTNTTTPGFTNQYSAYPGQGAMKTTAYAIGYIFDPVIIRLTEKAIGKPVISMHVTNSTYAYLSIRDGDAFAKKFGGETGSDPDFFLLTIKKYSGGAIADDSINVYLADYRSSDPSKDYILSDWKYVDMTVLGEVDSLILQLSSSDVGMFGMNTPAYVAIDQISTDNLLAAAALNGTSQTMIISPNPARESIFIDLPSKGQCSITSLFGSVLWSQSLDEGRHEVQILDWPQGIYLITLNGRVTGKFSVN